MPQDLLEAVKAVSVEDLSDVRAGPLVLHAGLDQVDRIDGGGTRRSGDRAQREAVHWLQNLDQETTVLWALKDEELSLFLLKLSVVNPTMST